MRILHVIAGLPSAGGMSELVPLLALEQRRLGHEVTVATVGPADAPTACAAERGGVRFVCYQACGPRFLYYSLEMQGQLRTLTKNADLVHVHGCWTFPVWWGCHLALKYHKPYVRSPHGCLDRERLKLSAWKKRLAGLFFERRYFERATVIHATAESEAEGIGEYLRSSFVHYCGSALVGKHEDEERSSKVLKYESFKVGEGGAVGKPQSAGSAILPISQPATPLSLHSNFRMKGRAYPRIVVVPNGVDSQAFNGRPAKAALDRRWPECAGKRVVLFLSRLHPIKGIDLLLLAWARVLNRPLAVGNGYASSLTPHPTPFDNWHLLIAGPDENGYAVSVKNRCLDDKTDSRVTFCGPLYGEDKYGVMATADLFVLPTRNENFGIVVAEALACGVPVITTKGAPWQELLGSPASSKVLKCESALVPYKPTTSINNKMFYHEEHEEHEVYVLDQAPLRVLRELRGEDSGLWAEPTLGDKPEDSGDSGDSAISAIGALSTVSRESGDSAISASGRGSEFSAMAKPVQGVTSSPKLNAPNALIQLNTLSPAIGRCGWWIEIGVDPLVEALREAMTLTDEERRAMCENGRRLVEAKYQWPMIAKAMEKVYEGCV